jgi:hypothetical protein
MVWFLALLIMSAAGLKSEKALDPSVAVPVLYVMFWGFIVGCLLIVGCFGVFSKIAALFSHRKVQ